MDKTNYQAELDKLLSSLEPGCRPRLLLHACCAPCSSYVLEYLAPFFSIDVFFFNPNISGEEEYEKRKKELIRFIDSYPFPSPVAWKEADYRPEVFFRMAEGLEDCPEGGARCHACYRLRLEETAREAAQGAYDYFCTTLSISPLKNAQKINEIGYELARSYHVAWLPSDFKKKEGYKQSIRLSAQYDLYRQDYCGCVYSKKP